MKTRIGVWLAGVLALGLAGSAQAALHDRGGGLIYDDVLNITWLSDANYAQTSGFDAGGFMTWDNAVAWAAGLSYFDAVRNVTYSDWRLPTALNQDGSGPCGPAFNCTDSEMGHMFYNNLSGTAFSSVLTSGDPDLALFSNLQYSFYWSGTEFAPNPTSAWDFNFNGNQSAINKNFQLFAWAVRPGDVAAVPEPASLALVGTVVGGLLGVGWGRRRR